MFMVKWAFLVNGLVTLVDRMAAIACYKTGKLVAAVHSIKE